MSRRHILVGEYLPTASIGFIAAIINKGMTLCAGNIPKPAKRNNWVEQFFFTAKITPRKKRITIQDGFERVSGCVSTA
jgi:hypothetical protein